jgi:hypothetical protein
MTEADVKVGKYYDSSFGPVRVDGHFMEGPKGERYKVYFTRRADSGTSYQMTASEMTGEVTETEWRKG